jgi:hypothetical protein
MKRIAANSVLVVLALSSFAGACPMCRDSVAGTGSGGVGGANQPPVALFNSSILLLLGAFLIVLAFLVTKIVGAIRLGNSAQWSASIRV